MNEALKQARREADWQKFKRSRARREAFARRCSAAVKDVFTGLWGGLKFLWPGLLVYYAARFYGESETRALIYAAAVLAFVLVRDEIVRPLREVRALLQAQEIANRPRPR